MVPIQLGQIIRTDDKFCIASVLGENGKQTEKRAFLPRGGMRIVTTRGLNPFILLGAKDTTQAVIGMKVAFIVDTRWDPSMGGYPRAFAWGLWENEEEEEEVIPPPPVEPMVSMTPVPPPYSKIHSGGARRPGRRKRRNERLVALVKANGNNSAGSADEVETSQLVFTKDHYAPDYFSVGLDPNTID